MSKLWIVTKNEFYRYFISPLAYVYLISFLMLNSSFALYFGHFFERGQADLYTMFAFQPWLYLLFIPGISMRLWSEEFRNKTILQIITMPVSITSLVWGKFLASWAFCAVALLLSFPFWITVNLLGHPDNSIIFISYIGSFLLAGCMLSISQTMSALTKNQVIALVLSVIANLLFFLSGLEYVLGFFRNFAPLPLIDMIASFSFLTHFDTISHGLIEARDLIFFISLILLFNFTTAIIISFKTSGTSRFLKSTHRNYYILCVFLLLGGFIGVNLLANNLLRRFQYDFTAEKIFTLTPATQEVLTSLKEPVTAKLYYSRILGERNPEFRLMFDKVRLLLSRYASLSNGRFNYRISYPEPLSNTEDIAISSGLQPLPIVDNSTNAFFGLTFTDEVENKQIIPFFPLERQNLLEQDLTQPLYLLNHHKKNLGILTSLPMFEEVIENVASPQWEIINQLKNFYNIVRINPQDNFIPKLDVLMLAHPRNLSPQMLQALKDYSLMRGKILAFFDVAAEAPLIFAPVKEELKPSDLGGLEQIWGFKFNKDFVVGDLANSSIIDATVDYKNNPNFTQDIIQFYLQGKSFNKEFKETALLKKMLISSAGTFEATDSKISYFIPLLQPSDMSALIPASTVYKNMHPSDILRQFQKDASTKYIGARIISKNAQQPFELIVVGDSDLLYDNFWTTHKILLENNYSIPILDNANFVFNALDTLTGDNTLISLRGKSELPRKFEALEIARKLAQQQFKIQENEIIQNIEKTKSGLREIWSKKDFEQRSNFTPDELAIIAGIRKSIDNDRQKLWELKERINQNANRIEFNVTFANIYGIPLILALFLLLYGWKKNRLNPGKSKLNQKKEFNKPLAYLGLSAGLILGAGVASVYFSNRQEISTLEGQKFFQDLPARINDISVIRLQSHSQTLDFYKDSKGTWKLRNAPQYLVYQDRIRSFLSALLEASYFEKKSAKMENLRKFGLAPLEVNNSPNIRVELKNAQEKTLESFEVGSFDIDLGRGSRGAYLKRDHKFQVWLVAIDLIALSTNPADWTFSTIWNLRFGRFAQINTIDNPDILSQAARIMLNTPLLSASDALVDAKLLSTYQVVIEGNQKLLLKFFTKENKYFLQYEFLTKPEANPLQMFADYAAGNYYEVSKEKFDEITKTLK